MLVDLEIKLLVIEEKICKNVEIKVVIIVEDVLVKGLFFFLILGFFDFFVGLDIVIVIEVLDISEVSIFII